MDILETLLKTLWTPQELQDEDEPKIAVDESLQLLSYQEVPQNSRLFNNYNATQTVSVATALIIVFAITSALAAAILAGYNAYFGGFAGSRRRSDVDSLSKLTTDFFYLSRNEEDEEEDETELLRRCLSLAKEMAVNRQEKRKLRARCYKAF